ncbi:MAG: rhodanese-like domain-containing protein [Bacteroidota bacterium]|nr:rhodanese-like domain-containing protein [Candidatus Kapabacteria bacterium]MDW8219685.1 rhodanese-like domain-containing protein [Bacteroidota bacterium]
MLYRMIYEKGLAQASYIIGCQQSGTAIVIDPKRDIDTYLEVADQEKLKITHIAETHIHADFLTGSRELAAATGAELLLSDEGGEEWRYAFSHTGLKDGSTFTVGNLRFEVWHTPGHTPEHIAFLLYDTPASAHAPIMFFTGDFVFVGDVGRPDLLEKAAGYRGTMEVGARQMFQSLKRFRTLPDFVQIMPGHGAGSACGKSLGAVPTSTVGYEKLVNWALQINDEEEFVRELLSGQPEPPKYFAMMKKLNKEERPLLKELPKPRRIGLHDIQQALDSGMPIIDTRSKLAFAGGHIPRSINIQNNHAFSTWAGWIMDYEKPFLVIASDHEIADIVRKLVRVGLDNIQGYLPSIEEWSSQGHELEIVEQISVHDLYNVRNIADYTLIDMRGHNEYIEGHIEGAINIHVGYVQEQIADLPKSKTLAIYCAGGDRSSIGGSILLRNGIKNFVNVTGGFNAWKEAGFPYVQGEYPSATPTSVAYTSSAVVS